MRRVGLLGSLFLVLGAFFAGGVPVFGDEGTVNVTVTAQAETCLTLETTTLNYGTLPFGGSADRQIQFDSCTPVSQAIMAHGTDATGTNWTLVTTGTCGNGLGLNQFKHNIMNLSTGSTFLSTQPQSIGTLAGNAVDRILGTSLIMPCAGSSGAGLTANTSIVLTTSLATP